MNEFTASNGRRLWVDDLGYVRGEYDEHNTVTYVRAENLEMLREFFQAEADERLGRWRWTTPGGGLDFVVTANLPPCSDWDLTVTCEQSGQSMNYKRADDEGTYPGKNYFAGAARAYFDAHPEPKPWHEAKPGEVWEITRAGSTDKAWRLESGAFMFDDESWVYAKDIEAGRRIWPEAVTS